MDSIDRTLLGEIVHNCRVSYETLARKTNLSPTAVKNRVRALIDTGVVAQFNTILDNAMLDADQFQAVIITNGTENIDEFIGRIGKNQMVSHVSTIASVTGGSYLVWGLYIGTTMLYELGVFLRSLEEVQTVEILTLLSIERGKKISFSKIQLKVLKHLVENPLSQISEISQNSGVSPKTVRKVLREFEEKKTVHFIARPDLAAGNLVNLHIRIVWDERVKSLEEIIEWHRENYPIEFWSEWISVSEPILYAEFVVENLHEAESITKQIRQAPFVLSTSTLVAYSSTKFPLLSEIKLKEMLDESSGK